MKTEGGERGERKWGFNFQREKATAVEMGVKKRRKKKRAENRCTADSPKSQRASVPETMC